MLPTFINGVAFYPAIEFLSKSGDSATKLFFPPIRGVLVNS
jgi:hypothetical protein